MTTAHCSRRNAWAAIAAAGIWCCLTSASAAADTPPQPAASNDSVVASKAAPASDTARLTLEPLAEDLDLMGKRLRRGAANAGLGWLEIPAGVQQIGTQHGIGAAATWGLLHGSGRAVQRTAVGLFEILTFPFQLTRNNQPIIEPEFVLDKSPADPAPAT